MSRLKSESLSGKYVYVVFQDDSILSICSSEENAKKFVPKYNRASYRIEPHTVDAGLDQNRPGFKFYLIYFNRYGRVTEAKVLPALYWGDEVWIGFDFDLEIRVWAESKDAAIERATEKREWLKNRKPGESQEWEDKR